MTQPLNFFDAGTPDPAGLDRVAVFTTAPVNRAPVVRVPVGTFNLKEGSNTGYGFSATLFSDPDGDKLTYTATLSNGQPLPPWLSFQSSLLLLSGTVPIGSPNYAVRLTATDPGGLNVSGEYMLLTQGANNRAPVQAEVTRDLTWREGAPKTTTFPPEFFIDPQGEALRFSATQSNGAPLPLWLSFDATTRTFSGTAPSNSPDYTIRITATDPEGLSDYVDTTFITVAAPTTTVTQVNRDFPGGTPTQNPYLDSLIGGGSFASGPNKGAAITWTVTTGQPVTLNDGTQVGTTALQGFELPVFRAALGQWANIANITFTEVAPDVPSDLIEGHYDPTQLGDPLGWLSKPGSVTLGKHESPYDSLYAGPLVGLFNASVSEWSESGLSPGGEGFITLLHELGHMLGLSHPHDGGHKSDATLFPGIKNQNPLASDLPRGDSDELGTFNLNQKIWTIMSYNDGWAVQSDGTPTGLKPANGEDWGHAGTPMAFDIAAIQSIYGANLAFHTGQDQYSLPLTNAPGTFWSCIWDAGGVDTLSAEKSLQPSTIDLRAAPLVGENAGGFVSNVGGIKGGFTIANGVVIEHAIGGQGADRIQGNDANNTLTGGLGNDTLDGGAGIDTAVFTGLRSAYTVGRTSAATTVQDLRTTAVAEGQDSLKGIERLKFLDKNVALDLDGHAGQAAKIIGAVFGAATVSNPAVVGVALSLLDDGLSYEALGGLAMQFVGATRSVDVVGLLWKNLLGTSPTPAQVAPLAAVLDGGMGVGAFTVVVADLMADQINLVGLSQTGLEYGS